MSISTFVLTMIFLVSNSASPKPVAETVLYQGIASMEACEQMREDITADYKSLGGGLEDRFSVGRTYTNLDLYTHATGFCTEKIETVPVE